MATRPFFSRQQTYGSLVDGRMPWSTLELAIAASEVRDHLSNERTFLASMKLTLALIVMSIATALEFHFSTSGLSDDGRQDHHHRVVVTLSYLYLLLAVANVIASTVNYFQTQKQYAAQVLWVSVSRGVQVVFVIMSITILAGNVYLSIAGD